ncbi:hypothetical protein GQ53DRAFT_808783 [Thozetella sp. PMI_491]|nr:hypothetical protein GQ53DRAFT_808783 [Thozetella sp. PMI_491]
MTALPGRPSRFAALFFVLLAFTTIQGGGSQHLGAVEAKPAVDAAISPVAVVDAASTPEESEIIVVSFLSVVLTPDKGDMASPVDSATMPPALSGGGFTISTALSSTSAAAVKNSVSTSAVSSGTPSADTEISTATMLVIATVTAEESASEITLDSSDSATALRDSSVLLPFPSSSLTPATSQPVPSSSSSAISGQDNADTTPVSIGVTAAILVLLGMGIVIYFYIRKKRLQEPARAETPPPFHTEVGFGGSILGSDEPLGTPPIELVNRPKHSVPSMWSCADSTVLAYSPEALQWSIPAASGNMSPPHPAHVYPPRPTSQPPGGALRDAYLPPYHSFPDGSIDPLRSSPSLEPFPAFPYPVRGPLEPVDEGFELP